MIRVNSPRPRICVSVAPRNAEELRSLLKRADDSLSDMVELRLDGLSGEELELSRAFHEAESRKPIILTYSTDPAIRLVGDGVGIRLLELLAPYASHIDAGAYYDSLELRKINKDAYVVISRHFDRPLKIDEGEAVLNELSSQGADIVKIVYRADDIEDNLVALHLSRKFGLKKVIFCMGGAGKISRVLCPLFGSEWTYASLGSGLETAPGQVEVQSLIRFYRSLLGGKQGGVRG
jgi:3-dehydroquinate dehydratase